jgi:AcrR family transcriptional regulator
MLEPMSDDERVSSGRKRSEASRAAILDAALRVLREVGYGRLTTDAIARAAGVGKQTIYRWWSSKADVVLEALAEHARTVDDRLTGSLEWDVERFMASTFRLLRGGSGTGPVLKGLMGEAQLEPDFAPRFAAFIQGRRSVLRGMLVRHAREDAPVDAAVDMLFDALWYRLLIGHAALGPALARDLARMIAHGLAP